MPDFYAGYPVFRAQRVKKHARYFIKWSSKKNDNFNFAIMTLTIA